MAEVAFVVHSNEDSAHSEAALVPFTTNSGALRLVPGQSARPVWRTPRPNVA
jgi:hypothetical protein